MISLEELLIKYNITEKSFETADIKWDDLNKIYNDFLSKKGEYRKILKLFEEEIMGNNIENIHSFRSRIKDEEHLIVKIIRKKYQNYSKYKGLTFDNYEKYITDLVGFRVFVLFKEDWIYFHNYITSKFKDDKNKYIVDWENTNTEDGYFIEAPKAHIRKGDNENIYQGISVENLKTYRSVHYTMKYKGIYIEIQLRTLFEESWGEIDHRIIYPYKVNDDFLRYYSDIMNRLAGMADEMGSFFSWIEKLDSSTVTPPFPLPFSDNNTKNYTSGLDVEIEDFKNCKKAQDVLMNVLNK